LLSVPVSDEEEVNSDRERKVRADQLATPARCLAADFSTGYCYNRARSHLSTRGERSHVALHELFGKPAGYPTMMMAAIDPILPRFLKGDASPAKSECQ
jgi:hypothetical protein